MALAGRSRIPLGLRRRYFALLDGLEVVPKRTTEQILTEEDDEFLRVLGSRLRTGMTRDVGTRRTFIFRSDTDRGTRVSEVREYIEDGGDRLLRISPRRRQRVPLIGARMPGHPVVELDGLSRPFRWHPSTLAFSARMPGSHDDGRPEERVFFIEDRQVVEGPGGWQRGDIRLRGKSVIWRQVESDTSPGGAKAR